MGSRTSSPAAARSIGIWAAVALAGSLGALPGPSGVPDAVACLVWLALVAAPLGYLGAALELRLFPWGLGACAAWLAAAGLAGVASGRALPALLWPALAWTGLYIGGHGLGLRLAGRVGAWRGAALLLLLGALQSGLPGRGGLPGAPWPEPLARALLDAAPTTLLVESAGVDWMRHPGIYDSVASDRFERQAWRGVLAGPAVLLVGCLLASAALAWRARSSRPHAGATPEERT